MIESYIEDGSQSTDDAVYGKSITDPCLGWEKTEKLIYEIAERVEKVAISKGIYDDDLLSALRCTAL